jgi:hypothetical protein
MLTDPAVPTAAIKLSVTTTTALLIGAAPVPSISRAAFITTVPFPIGGSGVNRGVGVCDATEALTAWTRNSVTAINLIFFTFVPLKWNVEKRAEAF